MLVQNFDILNNSPCFHDFRGLADDKILQRNPHKGFYVHYIDNGARYPRYRNTIAKGDYLLDFPGLNHMYIRFDWTDVEVSEGVFDFSCIDSIIEEWGKYGYRFSLRPCTFEGEGDKAPFATPAYVFERGAKYTMCGGTPEPDYNDEIYLYYLERFMCELGRKYNGHPLLEYIDVGTFGTWGEGHTYAGSNKIFPLETYIRHINLHAKYFPDSFVLVNDDLVNQRTEINKNDTLYLLDYCAGLGLGIRDDSILVDWYTANMGYNSVKSPFMFDKLWKFAPVDIERAHYHEAEADKDGPNELIFAEAIRDMHASFAGFHGCPRDWYKEHKYITEYISNRIGYWYFLDGAVIPQMISGLPCCADFYFRNKGCAPSYYKFDCRVLLRDGEGDHIVGKSDFDNRKWLPNEQHIERIKLDLSGIKAGDYTLMLGMFDGTQPVKLAIDTKYLGGDGYYSLCRVNVNNSL